MRGSESVAIGPGDSEAPTRNPGPGQCHCQIPRTPAPPARGPLATFFLESIIFIDQATANGTRPNSPVDDKPATTPSPWRRFRVSWRPAGADHDASGLGHWHPQCDRRGCRLSRWLGPVAVRLPVSAVPGPLAAGTCTGSSWAQRDGRVPLFYKADSDSELAASGPWAEWGASVSWHWQPP